MLSVYFGLRNVTITYILHGKQRFFYIDLAIEISFTGTVSQDFLL
jgi:hypothetical protein